MSKRRWIAVAVGAAIVVVGVLLGVFLTSGPDPSPPDSAVDVAIEGEPSGVAPPDAEAGPSPGAGTAPDDAPGERVEEARGGDAAAGEGAGEARPPAGEAAGRSGEDDAASPVPSFDVVRINRRGEAVIAGRSTPGARVTVRDGSQEVGSTIADQRGEWVLVPGEPLRGGTHALSAVETREGGATVESQDVVVVSVPDRDDAQAGALAVKVPRDGVGASRVLQRPGQEAQEQPAEAAMVRVPGEGLQDGAEGALAVESIDYDAEGGVVITGKAEPHDTVNVYVDDEHVGTVETGEKGGWEIAPGDRLPPGEHRLRVDRVDREGIVLARIETPLVRVEPEDIPFGDALVVVQPGNSLWRIARRTLGGGVHYTVIYEANRSQIGDPTLIYPGQIFTVPQFD